MEVKINREIRKLLMESMFFGLSLRQVQLRAYEAEYGKEAEVSKLEINA